MYQDNLLQSGVDFEWAIVAPMHVKSVRLIEYIHHTCSQEVALIVHLDSWASLSSYYSTTKTNEVIYFRKFERCINRTSVLESLGG